MAHTLKDKARLVTRVRRIKGQVEAIERMLEEEKECYQTLQAISACRGAINGLMAEVLEGHVRFHVADAKGHGHASRQEAADEVSSIIKSFLK